MPTLFEEYQQIDKQIDPNGNGVFPNLYILDESWFESQKVEVEIEKFSKIGTGEPEHSKFTLTTIKMINHSLKDKVIGLGAERDNFLENANPGNSIMAHTQPSTNVYEALQSLMMTLNLKKDDIFIANIELPSDNGKISVVSDELCRNLLLKVIEDFGVIAIVSSGNERKALDVSENLVGDIIVVGSFIGQVGNFTTESRFGESVTCYAEGDAQIKGFGQSSFATAQMAGVVMEMQKYVHIKNANHNPLTPAEVKNILKNEGDKITIAGLPNCNIPTWPKIQAAIDLIRP